MATYRHPKYGISVEVDDEATPEAVNIKLKEAEKAHIAKQLQAGQARQRPPGEPAGPVTPEGQSTLEQVVSAIRERMSAAVEGATTGGLVGGPTGMALGGLAGAGGVLPDWMTGAGKVATGAAPSVVGGLAGRAIGSRLGPIGATVGGATGSLAGEALAQQTGLTEKSDLGLAAAALPIPTSAAARTVTKTLPGAAKGIRAAASPIWQEVENLATQLGVRVEPRETLKAAIKLLPETGLEFATGPMKRMIRQGTQVGAKLPEGIPYKEFVKEKTLLGRRVGELTKKRGPELGAAKTFYGAMNKDLDTVIEKAPPELKTLLVKATRLSKEAGTSEKVEKLTSGYLLRGLLTGGAWYAGGTPAGVAAYAAPTILKAGLETPRGVKIIKTVAERGGDIDQIVNALVQVGIGTAKQSEQDEAIGYSSRREPQEQ